MNTHEPDYPLCALRGGGGLDQQGTQLMYTARVYSPGKVWPHGEVLAITETFDACADRVLDHLERNPDWYKYTVETEGVLVGTFKPDDEGEATFESGAPGTGTIVRGSVQVGVNAVPIEPDTSASNRNPRFSLTDWSNIVRGERDDEWAALTGGRWITVAEWKEYCAHWDRTVWYVRCVPGGHPKPTELLVARFADGKWWSMADTCGMPRGTPFEPAHVLITAQILVPAMVPDAKPSLARTRIELDVLSEVAAAWEAVEPEDVSAAGFARWLRGALDSARERAGGA
jgi:hypothetical protein